MKVYKILCARIPGYAAALLIGLAVGVLIAEDGPTAQELSLEQQILSRSQGWFDALMRADVDVVASLQTDDYLTIQQTPTGVTVVNKAQQLASLLKAPSDRPRFDRSLTNVRVRQYGDVAIVTALAAFNSGAGEKQVRSRAVTTEVWVKIGGQWRLAHFQPTDIVSQPR
jgi:uncharacterized protein (TIGR02246 family)